MFYPSRLEVPSLTVCFEQECMIATELWNWTVAQDRVLDKRLIMIYLSACFVRELGTMVLASSFCHFCRPCSGLFHCFGNGDSQRRFPSSAAPVFGGSELGWLRLRLVASSDFLLSVQNVYEHIVFFIWLFQVCERLGEPPTQYVSDRMIVDCFHYTRECGCSYPFEADPIN